MQQKKAKRTFLATKLTVQRAKAATCLPMSPSSLMEGGLLVLVVM
jgi:hypothetical protein